MNPKLAEFAKASPHPTLPPDPVPVLRAGAARDTDARTSAMILGIDNKVSRLEAARAACLAALNRNRYDLARATPAAPAGPAHDAKPN